MTRGIPAALATLALLAPSLSAQTAPPQDGPTEIVLHVDGLACPICAYRVEKKLGALEETQAVTVDLEKRLVHLTLKPGRDLQDEVLVKTVKDSGFVVRRIERPGKSGAVSRSGR